MNNIIELAEKRLQRNLLDEIYTVKQIGERIKDDEIKELFLAHFSPLESCIDNYDWFMARKILVRLSDLAENKPDEDYLKSLDDAIYDFVRKPISEIVDEYFDSKADKSYEDLYG